MTEMILTETPAAAPEPAAAPVAPAAPAPAAPPPPPMPGEEFHPEKYLMDLRGRNGAQKYLEVKWRLLWLRTEHPDAMIETECVRNQDNEAIFKARISIPGGGSATGWGSESIGDFRDYLEKAETKAIGRACAALGYGTQFTEDHDSAEAERGPGRDTRPDAGNPGVVARQRGPAAPPPPPPPQRQEPRPADKPRETVEQTTKRLAAALFAADTPPERRAQAADWLFKRAATVERVQELYVQINDQPGLLTEPIRRSYVAAVARLDAERVA